MDIKFQEGFDEGAASLEIDVIRHEAHHQGTMTMLKAIGKNIDKTLYDMGKYRGWIDDGDEIQTFTDHVFPLVEGDDHFVLI